MADNRSMSPQNIDYGQRAQIAAEEHLMACWDYLHDDGEEPEDLAGPFCGCQTCEVRETLHAAYPHLQEMWQADLEFEMRNS